MPNNYTTFALHFTINDEEASWFQHKLLDPPLDWLDPSDAEAVKSESTFPREMLGFEYEIDYQLAPASITIWAEETGLPHNVARMLQSFLCMFRPSACIGFEYAMTCSDPKAHDEFAGGALFVTCEDIEHLDTQSWLKNKALRHHKIRHAFDGRTPAQIDKTHPWATDRIRDSCRTSLEVIEDRLGQERGGLDCLRDLVDHAKPNDLAQILLVVDQFASFVDTEEKIATGLLGEEYIYNVWVPYTWTRIMKKFQVKLTRIPNLRKGVLARQDVKRAHDRKELCADEFIDLIKTLEQLHVGPVRPNQYRQMLFEEAIQYACKLGYELEVYRAS